jgi:hypothetical protein
MANPVDGADLSSPPAKVWMILGVHSPVPFFGGVSENTVPLRLPPYFVVPYSTPVLGSTTTPPVGSEPSGLPLNS